MPALVMRPMDAVLAVAWSCIAFALADRIERRRFGSSAAPSPFAIGGAAICVVCVAAATAPLAAAAVASATIASAGADARRGYLFDAVTFPTAAIAIVAALRPEFTQSACLGAIALGGSFAAVHAISRGRAIGLGDVKVLFAIGVAFGLIAGFAALFCACVSGIAQTLIARARGHGTPRALPFGPHLAMGAVVTLAVAPAFFH